MVGRELGLRLIVAAVGIPAVLGMVLLGEWVLGVAAALAAAIGAHEFYALASARGVKAFSGLGVVASMGIVLLATAYPNPAAVAPMVMGVLLMVTLTSVSASVWLRWPEGGPTSAVAVTVMGVLYVGVTLAFVPILRALPDSVSPQLAVGRVSASAFILLPILVAWAGDSAAFFSGRAWGKTKLAPHVSPGKTRVGGLFGLLGSAAAAAVIAWLGPSRFSVLTLSIGSAIWLGAVLGAAGQIGDLAESVLKREAGVKDSGVVFPGHGGMLDRLDGLLFSFPLTWILLSAMGVIPWSSS